MAKGVLCSLFIRCFGELLLRMGNGIMDSPGHSGTLSLCPFPPFYCFSFQIRDCTSSFHMKEFSLFK